MGQAALIFDDREVLAGERIVLFDNERGKGDHKHIRGVESAYRFEGPEKLIEDFKREVEKARRKES